jgi:hypothetical protein
MEDLLAHSRHGFGQQGAYSPHPHIPVNTIQASIMATVPLWLLEQESHKQTHILPLASFLNEDPLLEVTMVEVPISPDGPSLPPLGL